MGISEKTGLYVVDPFLITRTKVPGEDVVIESHNSVPKGEYKP